MEKLKEKTTDLVDHVEELANTFYRLTVVNVAQKTSTITSGIVVALIMGIVGFMVLLLLSVALSLWLGDILENRAGGFLLGGGIFLVILLVIILLRKQIAYPVRDFIIRQIYD